MSESCWATRYFEVSGWNSRPMSWGHPIRGGGRGLEVQCKEHLSTHTEKSRKTACTLDFPVRRKWKSCFCRHPAPYYCSVQWYEWLCFTFLGKKCSSLKNASEQPVSWYVQWNGASLFSHGIESASALCQALWEIQRILEEGMYTQGNFCWAPTLCQAQY